MVENVRNFDYRTESEYTVRWEPHTYDLDRLRGVDLFLSFWGPPLAISIDTRKERGEIGLGAPRLLPAPGELPGRARVPAPDPRGLAGDES